MISIVFLFLISTNIFCGRARINSQLLKNFIFDVDREDILNMRFTPEQLKPQVFEENPFEYSGYFTVDEKHGGEMYYIFFPSKDGNESTPIIVWLQGGPGCSSLTGLFVENGPYKIDGSTLKLVDNPYTWNNHYHMIFVDQPIGTGWSFFSKQTSYEVTTEKEVGENMYEFFKKFFEDDRYSQYKDNDLYLFGESYAGKYIPAITQKIMDEKFEDVNLKGIGIGDGLTHPIVQFAKYHEYGWPNSLFDFNHDLDSILKLEDETVALIMEGKYTEANDKFNDACDIVDKTSGGCKSI